MAAFVRHGRPTRRHLRLISSNPTPSSLPRTRGDCENGPRPCPLVSCRNHLALDASTAGGVAIHWLPDDEPNRPSCALDVADEGARSVEEVASLLDISRERVRQIIEAGVRKIKRARGLREWDEP